METHVKKIGLALATLIALTAPTAAAQDPVDTVEDLLGDDAGACTGLSAVYCAALDTVDRTLIAAEGFANEITAEAVELVMFILGIPGPLAEVFLEEARNLLDTLCERRPHVCAP
jgi:hypothetical protein